VRDVQDAPFPTGLLSGGEGKLIDKTHGGGKRRKNGSGDEQQVKAERGCGPRCPRLPRAAMFLIGLLIFGCCKCGKCSSMNSNWNSNVDFDPRTNLLVRKDFETDALALTLFALQAVSATLKRWGQGRLTEEVNEKTFLSEKKAYKACAKTQTLVENVQGVVLILIQTKGKCRR